ncbi:MAG: hypothetical protein LBH35_11155 [Treponema sp.]|jgi:hypothetical protein|nr:hypothetical protein [Treponema sp.]
MKKLILVLSFYSSISLLANDLKYESINNNITCFSDYTFLVNPKTYNEPKRGVSMDEDTKKGLTIGTYCLLYTTTSILMRELVYKNNYSNNWMGSVNSFITLSGIGGGLGFLLWYFSNNGHDSILTPFIFTFVGIIGGSIINFAIPGMQNSFKENAFLYYTAPAVIGGLGIFGLTIKIREEFFDK